MTTTDPIQFTVLTQRWDEFTKAFDKLNRRAVKCGCATSTFKVTGEAVETRYHDDGDRDPVTGDYVRSEYKVQVRYVVVEGTPPKMAGFTFVARLEALGDELLVHNVPGYEGDVAPVRYRDSSMGLACEHCHTARRRKHLYLVREDATGKWRQVGRQCLRDFLGHKSPEAVIAAFEYWAKMGGMGERFGSGPIPHPEWDTDAVLTLTAAVCRTRGWVPRSAMQESSTSDEVCRLLKGEPPRREKDEHAWWEKLSEAVGEPTKDDAERGSSARSWIVGQDTASNEYLNNLRLILEQPTTLQRHLGLACSVIRSYEKNLGFLTRQQARTKAHDENVAGSAHIGAIGDRIDFTGKIERTWTGESHFGAFHIITIRTTEGLAVVYKGGKWLGGVDEEVSIRATVKDHTTFRDEKQTLVARPGLLD